MIKVKNPSNVAARAAAGLQRIATSGANGASPAKTTVRLPILGAMGDGRSVEIAPGQTVIELPDDMEGKIAVSFWCPAGDGTYRLKAKTMDRWVRMSSDIFQRLCPISCSTLRRLMRAGFIEYSQPAPMFILVNLESFFTHLENCKDPEFWERPENIKRYQQAL